MFSTNARGDSTPLTVNYETPIDVAEGRLSSDTAYNSNGNGSKSGMLILAIVLALVVVFGSVMTTAVVVILKRRRRERQTADDDDDHQEEHQVRSTTLVSVEDCQIAQSNFSLDEINEPHSSNTVLESEFCTSSTSPTFDSANVMGTSALPSMPCSNTALMPSKFPTLRGTTQRERIVRTVPHEPPDPDILLYRLKSSGIKSRVLIIRAFLT